MKLLLFKLVVLSFWALAASPQMSDPFLGKPLMEAASYPHADAVLICVGQASEDVHTVYASVPGVIGSVEFPWDVRTIKVESVLKGAAISSFQLQYLPRPSGTSGGLTEYNDVEPNKRYLFFLDQANTGDADFLLPSSQEPALIPLGTSAPGIKSVVSTPEQLIADELASALTSVNDQDVHQVIDAVSPAFFTSNVQAALTTISNGGDSDKSWHALSRLCILQDISGFQGLLNGVKIASKTSDMSAEISQPKRIKWIKVAILSFRRPEAEHLLFDYLSSGPAAFIPECLNAYSNVSNYQNSSVLTNFLDNPDPEVQFAALQALFQANSSDPEILTNDKKYYASTLETFIVDRTEYVNSWKTFILQKYPTGAIVADVPTKGTVEKVMDVKK